ncbi:MAG: Ig-like domain-containing protein, partial [Crocinitomicaceae bacterium]
MNQKITIIRQFTKILLFILAPASLFAQPVANNDNGTGNEDQVITVTAIQNNDVANASSLVLSSIDINPSLAGNQSSFTSANGQWSVDYFTGDVIFVPNAHFNGTERISYSIQNNLGQVSNLVQINVNQSSVNDSTLTLSN